MDGLCAEKIIIENKYKNVELSLKVFLYESEFKY